MAMLETHSLKQQGAANCPEPHWLAELCVLALLYVLPQGCLVVWNSDVEAIVLRAHGSPIACVQGGGR